MSDTTAEATETAPEAEQEVPESTEDPRISKANQEAAKYRRELRAAQAELEKVRQAGLSEQEKAVSVAKAEGHAEALRAAAPRMVRAELRAAAAESGVAKYALDGFLEYADLSKFVGDDGEPDSKAIAAAMKKLGGGKPADFDGGARTTAPKGADMNSLIRHAAGIG
jgi:hypothetical protein